MKTSIPLLLLLVACGGGGVETTPPDAQSLDTDEVFEEDDSWGVVDLGDKDSGSPKAGEGSVEAGLGGEGGGEAGASGSAGEPEAGLGGSGEDAATPDAGDGDASVDSGQGEFVPEREMFLGTWDFKVDQVSVRNCPPAGVEEMLEEIESADYPDCGQFCKVTTKVGEDYAFEFVALAGTFDHWDGSMWVGRQLDSSVDGNKYSTVLFWLVDEDTIYGFSYPDEGGHRVCELYQATRSAEP